MRRGAVARPREPPVIVDASIRPNPVAWNRIIESMKERPESFASVEEATAYFQGNLPGMPQNEQRG